MKMNNIYQWEFKKIDEDEVQIAVVLLDYYIKQYNRERNANNFIIISYNDSVIDENYGLIINIWINYKVTEEERKALRDTLDYEIHRIINQL